MSVIGSIFSSDVSDLRNPALWLVNALAGRLTTAGQRVTPSKSLTFSAYMAAIRNISEDVAKLPLIVYRRRPDGGKDRATDHPVFRLLHLAPNDEMGAMSFRETITHHALGWGNGYAEIERRGDGKPVALHLIHPSRVQILRDTKTRKIFYRVTNDGGRRRSDLPADDVLHIHGLGDDGIQGYSVLQYASESIGMALAAQEFGSAFFGNGTALSGVLEHPGKLSDPAKDYLRESWAEMHAGTENAYKPGILEEGMKWQQLGIPPEEAQFLQTRQFQVEEIARWFRIPPHKLQHLLRSTFSNIESQNIEYVVDTLTSWFKRWEEQILLKLFSTAEQAVYFAEHLAEGLLRGDSKARSQFYREQFNIGALSQNEIRGLENRNPIGPHGDVHYVPLAMRPSDQPAPDAKPSAPRGPRAVDAVRVKRSYARVFADIAERVVNRENRAAARAAAKAEDGSAFDAWLSKFLPEHEQYHADAFGPAVLAMVEMIIFDDPVIAQTVAQRVTDAASADYCARLEGDLRTGYEAGDMKAMCDSRGVAVPGAWTQHLTEAIADAVENETR